MADLKAVAESLIKGQAPEVEKGVQAALDEGVPVREILHEGLIAGMNVVGDKFVESVRESGVQIVCMSALLTTTMPSMKATVDALKEAGVTDKVRTMVGGAPVTEAYAEQIGADGYAPDAASAADRAKDLIADLSS